MFTGNILKKNSVIIFLVFFIALNFWFLQKNKGVENVEVVRNIENVEKVQVDESVENLEEEEPVQEKEDVQVVKDVLLDAPFVLQAPLGNWEDLVFQDACEEAAILMATGWLKGKAFTSQEAFDEIKKIVEIEKTELGEYIDASAGDTALILKKYSKSGNIEVFENFSLEDLISEISKENLVIVPTNGRKLGNPNYTPPGPITHMIVIVGYDSVKKEFVTNDSGTKRGEGYRYEENVLFGAIRDYPTGNHYLNPISENDPKKTMIVVKND